MRSILIMNWIRQIKETPSLTAGETGGTKIVVPSAANGGEESSFTTGEEEGGREFIGESPPVGIYPYLDLLGGHEILLI
jgi:hypothetical protein